MPKPTDIPQTKLLVEVHPSAGRNEVKGFDSGILKVKLAAPPVEGKANRAMVEFLSDILNIPKSNIVIDKGLTSRKKTVIIRGLELAGILHKLGLA